MTKEERNRQVLKYIKVTVDTYIIFINIVSFIVGSILGSNFNMKFMDTLIGTIKLMFHQYSYIFAIVAPIVSMDILMLENIKKNQKDYSILLGLNSPKNFWIKFEIACSVIGVQAFMIIAYILSWIKELYDLDNVYVPNEVYYFLIFIGVLGIVLKCILGFNRGKKYKIKFKNNR